MTLAAPDTMNTPKTTPHTPTPWHIQAIGSHRYVEAQGPKFICDMQRDEATDEREIAESDANAAHIVRCVNAHEKLVQALQGMLGNYLELKRIALCVAKSDAPGWVGSEMTPEDDIHVIAAKAAIDSCKLHETS